MKRFAVYFSFLLAGCSQHDVPAPLYGQVGVAIAPQSINGNTISKAGPVNAISGGALPLGVAMPSGPAIVARIENGLEGSAKSTGGNFARGLAQAKPNLPNSANIVLASGFDQVELLAYAACSDLTTGTTPFMQSKYGVTASGSIASQQTLLVSAGMRMLDQHTAGLASRGADKAALEAVLNNLVQQQATVGTNTATIAFMAVCIAANTAGSVMLGL